MENYILLVASMTAGLIAVLICVFIGHITVMDAIFTGLYLLMFGYYVWSMGLLESILVGAAAAAFCLFLKRYRVSFWIEALLFTACWGYTVYLAFVYFYQDTDIALICTAFGSFCMFALHVLERFRHTVHHEDSEPEEPEEPEMTGSDEPAPSASNEALQTTDKDDKLNDSQSSDSIR